MQVILQSVDEIVAGLQPLHVDWRDETAIRVIQKLRDLPRSDHYGPDTVLGLLESNFEDGMLLCRLFLDLSKDSFAAVLQDARGGQGGGKKAFQADPEGFAADLEALGVCEALRNGVNRELHWSDVFVERLKSGRGSAISGQKRGRGLEDFSEGIVRRVFGERFQARCSFVGANGDEAKCDIAIPGKETPRILIEAKGYGATGSKMSDVLGDLRRIADVKRPDTALLLLTDGLSWRQRLSDLKKIVEMQNSGKITRIYTLAMGEQFETDLRQLGEEAGLFPMVG